MAKILLQDIKDAHCLSYSELSDLTGISKSTLHRIAIGQLSPKLSTLETIAKALRIRVEELYFIDYND